MNLLGAMIVKENRKISNNNKEAPPNTVNKVNKLVTVFADVIWTGQEIGNRINYL
jgi:hypothetical protein